MDEIYRECVINRSIDCIFFTYMDGSVQTDSQSVIWVDVDRLDVLTVDSDSKTYLYLRLQDSAVKNKQEN